MYQKSIVALCSGLFVPGCASLIGTFGGPEPNGLFGREPYVGTKVDAAGAVTLPACALGAKLKNCPSSRGVILLWLFLVIDLPPSVIADTVLLPYTLSRENSSAPGNAQNKVDTIDDQRSGSK